MCFINPTIIFIFCFFSLINCEYTHVLYLPANNITTETQYSHNSLSTIQSRQSCHLKPSVHEMTRYQLENYFEHHSEQQIFSNPCLFTSDEFCAYARQLPGYNQYVKKYYKYYKNYPLIYKAIGIGLTDTYTWDLENKLKRLYHQVLQQEQLHEKQQKQKLEQSAQQKKQQQIYQSLLGAFEQLDCTPLDHQLARHRAIERMCTTEHTTKAIAIDDSVIEFAKTYAITKQQLTEGIFNEYQHQLHAEFIEQLNNAMDFNPIASDYYVQNISDMLGETIALGIEANHNENVMCATHMANLGWALLDIAQGVAEGLAIGAFRTGKFAHDILRHPVKTTCDMVRGIGTVLYCLGKIVEVPLKLHVLYEMGNQEQASIYEQEITDTIQYLTQACKTHITSMSGREIARETTAFCTDWLLTGKAIQLSSKALSHLQPLVHEIFEILKREPPLEYAVASAEGIVYQMSESLEKIGGAAKEIAQHSQFIIEAFHAEFIKKLELEIALLRSMFDNTRKGFNEFANKYLKFPYEHIFNGKFNFNKNGPSSLDGLHHDFNHMWRNNSPFQFIDKAVKDGGWYKSEIWHNGRYIDTKTFFPAHWSREKVMNVICEAYDYFMVTGLEPSIKKGKYLIKGLTKEGIEIEIYITKNGKITTVYPILNKEMI